MNRHGVTASFHTNEPTGTQTSISALLTCTSGIKNAIQNNMIYWLDNKCKHFELSTSC